MPSVLQAPLISNVSYMLKDRPSDQIGTGFTSVNGRASPPSLPRLHGMGSMTSDANHAQSSRNGIEHSQERKWHSAPRGAANGHHSISPPADERDGPGSPSNQSKRKRTSSPEDESSSSPESVSPGDDSTNIVNSHRHLPPMDSSQQRTLPPMDRPEQDRNWAPRETQERNSYSEPRREHRNTDPSQDPNSNRDQGMGSGESQHAMERSSTTEMTRAGVQVDTKKRRRFANRTKTGCGTCRRRKKKCDETKPECNNCLRGGFICEGYANKVPWPKNGATKPHPPLQAKDRYPPDSAQLYHNHGTSRESYSEQSPHGPNEGAPTRPIVVEEHDRQTPVSRNGWGQSWGEPPRPSYPPEQPRPSEYTHLPALPTHPRPPSSEHHPQQTSPNQGPSSQRQANPRIYHHTPQTMSQVVNTSPAVTAEAALHHQPQQPHPPPSQQPPHSAPHTSAPPPPPSHYVAPPPPKPQRSEKDKMLAGEPFMPYHAQLVEERERCKGLTFRYNSTANSMVEIIKDERERHFRAILAAPWSRHSRDPSQLSGHVGTEVSVDTPFNCDYGYNIHIGNRVAIGAQCRLLDSGRITIGMNTTIGANVTVDTQRVPTDTKTLKGTRGYSSAAEVIIGDNVWIGANTTICAGVKIGSGAIIWPGSTVIRVSNCRFHIPVHKD
ncbi:hypothetical protein P154DRAFT_131490 [Amniculicola lignicola CBS 123094]|uniref:Zn(2)-C6 fungal-type domain-containing protein n=1 Tax=Amniculicola lignicola CBS 123094 TaxID=1392246 RepID=A0A6A5WL30_9PLEO|nr:hypothetical protein P154DRAFT_131490 [Amniculicola lignicola CBS 123094]